MQAVAEGEWVCNSIASSRATNLTFLSAFSLIEYACFSECAMRFKYSQIRLIDLK